MDYYDYYKVIGVSSSASTFEIKKKFKSKAKLIHPDINPSPKAKEAFQVLQRAYATLSNPKLRKQYDLQLQFINASRIIRANKAKNYNYANSSPSPPFGRIKDAQPGKFFLILLYLFGIFVGAIFMSFSLSIFFLEDPSYVLALLSFPGFILIRDGISGLRRQRLGDGSKD